MGRYSYSNRLTVGDCKRLSTQFFRKHGYYNKGFSSGRLKWSRDGVETGSIQFAMSTSPGMEYLHLCYTYTSSDNVKAQMDYQVKLTSTSCYYGGKRWWFICSITANGQPCSRRVGALYLCGKYFGCRHCHNLTYSSCKNSHSMDRLFREIGIDPKLGNKIWRME